MKSMKCAVAFGEFDGVHIGHRAVIKKLTEFEKSIVISFSSEDEDVIYCEEEKSLIMHQLGVGSMMSFKKEKSFDLGNFVKNFLVEMGADAVVCGQNYKDLKTLETLCSETGLELVVVPEVMGVSSEKIKELIRTQGKLDEALKLLGGQYILSGIVVHGKGVGRKVGMPTANLRMNANKILPAFGVYGSAVLLDEGVFKGMTNIGLRPSDDDSRIPTVETYILNFDKDIYGEVLTLDLFEYVRPVKKFKSLEDVKAQVDKDILQVQSFAF